MNLDKYNFIHYFSFANSRFNKTIIEIINNNDSLHPLSNLFIFTSQEEYNRYKDKCRCIYSNNMPQVINTYGKDAKIIFLHGVSSPIYLFKIKNSILKKTIWRTWGSDMYTGINKNSIIKKCINNIAHYFIKKKVHKLLAVGIANDIDLFDITERFGKCRTIEVPYYYEENDIINHFNSRIYVFDRKIKIMLGHSGFDNDNHISVLNNLQKNINFHNFLIYCPMSYGDCLYIKKVERYVEESNLNNVIFIKKHMSLYEYVSFINDMDLVILDGLKSYAIGNLSIALSLGSSICLNKDGVLAKVFSNIKIPYSLSANLQFDDIIHKNNVLNILENNLIIHDKEYYISQWEHIFSLADREEGDI